MPVTVDLKDVSRCVRCGSCRSVCPAFRELGWESTSTRGRMMVAGMVADGFGHESCLESLNTCTTCGLCAATCPAGVDPPALVERARAVLAENGMVLSEQARLRTLALFRGNVLGEAGPRQGWVDLLPRRVADDIPTSSTTVYFAGCVNSYRYPQTAANAYLMLQPMGIGLLADEVCCGSPLFRTGMDARSLQEQNLAQMDAVGASEVVTGCAGCYAALRADYPSRMRVYSLPEYLVENRSRIRLKKLDLKVTYHDPCHLGRRKGIFEEPRQIIESICHLVEMKANRLEARCCGGGGGVRAAFPELSLAIARRRLEDVPSGVDYIVTCCPMCIRNLRDAGAGDKVIDLGDLVSMAIAND